MNDKKNDIELNVSLKDILLMALIGVCLWLYLNPFDSSKIKDLEKSNNEKTLLIKRISEQRDSLKREREFIDTKIDSLKKVQIINKETIDRLTSESKIKDVEIRDLKDDLKSFDGMIKENDQKIKYLKNNPIKLPKGKLVSKLKEKI